MEKKDKETYVEKKYREFYEKNGYIPKYFVPYNCKEIIDYAPTLATECGTPGHISNILIIEEIEP